MPTHHRFADLFTPAPARRPVREALADWMPVARMMGLTLGDGTEIESVRLGDGTAIEEIRKGDGTVLWSGEPDIPDSVVAHADYYYPADEGSGSTVSPSIWSVNVSLNFSTWTSGSQYNGGVAPSFNGVDNIGTTASGINTNSNEQTVCGWVENLNDNGNFTGLFNSNNSNATPSNGWLVFSEQSTSSWGLRYYNSGNVNDVVRNLSTPDAADNHLFVAVRIDGDAGALLFYETNGTQYKGTGNASRGTSSDEFLSIMAGFEDYMAGNMDDVVVSSDTALTDDQIETIRDDTGPNA